MNLPPGLIFTQVKVHGKSRCYSKGLYEFPTMGVVGPQTLGGTTNSLFFYVENVDAAFDRAVKAGATSIMPVADQFWGDRFACVVDPFGHKWGISTHIADLSKEEIEKAQAEFCKKQMAHAK